jgi:hypothetical protein
MTANHEDIMVGDRVKLIHMPDDPDPIPAGSVGTVVLVTDLNFPGEHQTQFLIKWDNGRSLSCVCPPDILEKVTNTEVADGSAKAGTTGGQPV